MSVTLLTPDYIESKIKEEVYDVIGSTMTICVLTLENGFMVTGESAVAHPENFDAKIGRDIARKNAVDKIWAFEGYLMKEKMLKSDERTVTDVSFAKDADLLGTFMRIEVTYDGFDKEQIKLDPRDESLYQSTNLRALILGKREKSVMATLNKIGKVLDATRI